MIIIVLVLIATHNRLFQQFINIADWSWFVCRKRYRRNHVGPRIASRAEPGEPAAVSLGRGRAADPGSRIGGNLLNEKA